MTREQIEQYANLKREIVMLDGQIYAAENAGEYAADSVKGSTKEMPYALHSIAIKGCVTRRAPTLHRRKATLEAECAAVENYIDGVADSVMRQLLTRRYIEGRTTAESAQLVGYSRKQATRLINSFLAKMSHNVP